MVTDVKSLFQLDPSRSEPLYKQLVAQAQRLIAAGSLPAGTELPSVRELAAEFAINPMTISKAYSQLEAEGLLSRPRGARMQVAQNWTAASSLSARTALIKPAAMDLVRQSLDLGLTLEHAIAAVKDGFKEQ